VQTPLFPLVRARRLAQRPAVRRTLAVALALVTGLVAASLLQAGDAARRSWGVTRPVAVATRDLAPGDTLGPGEVEVRPLPAALVPAAALRDAPAGATVRQPVLAGEPLVPTRLAPDGLAGTAALVPEGYRAVSVPAAAAGLPVTVGDQVDVLAVLPPDPLATAPAPPAADEGGPSPPGADDPAFPLVERAVVVDVGDEAVAVAVPVDDAPRVAFALAQGSLVLALVGP
jgi:Flp pilus assembly protein CpaB